MIDDLEIWISYSRLLLAVGCMFFFVSVIEKLNFVCLHFYAIKERILFLEKRLKQREYYKKSARLLFRADVSFG